MIHARQDFNRMQDPAGKIPHDEPVFLLRGQDVLAAPTLRHYSDLCLRASASASIGGLSVDSHQSAHLRAIASQVDSHADLMDKWTVSKLPTVAAPPDSIGPMLQWDCQAGALRGAWQVTCIMPDKDMVCVVFTGHEAQRRAMEYRHYMNSAEMMAYLAAQGH